MNKSDLARRRRQLDRAKLPKTIPLLRIGRGLGLVTLINEQQQTKFMGPPKVCLQMLKESKAESELGSEHAERYLQKVISKVEALIDDSQD